MMTYVDEDIGQFHDLHTAQVPRCGNSVSNRQTSAKGSAEHRTTYSGVVTRISETRQPPYQPR